MTYTRIKICGITSVGDAQAAESAGADALGLVFYPPSPRHVSVEQAREIAFSLGPFITLVGLFVDADISFVRSVLNEVPLHVLQFHGSETEAYCSAFGRPYLKALPMHPELDPGAEIKRYASASAILLDAYRPGVPGGTGEVFDWQRVPLNSSKPLILAGGLTPQNVALALSTTGVYGIDVSGGVELAPGKKDANKVQTFINNARNGSLR